MSALVLDQLQQVQRALEALYQLEPAPDVADFVEMNSTCQREVLLVHHLGDTLQLRLLLPTSERLNPGLCDRYLQAVEGVSHFLLVTERARRELPTTLLELELQAEVDKFALLLHLQHERPPGPHPSYATAQPHSRAGAARDGMSPSASNDNAQERPSTASAVLPRSAADVHQWLFDRVTFLHPPSSSEGDRYRAANRLAARFWARLLARTPAATRSTLQRFYGAGPHEKIRLAKAV